MLTEKKIYEAWGKRFGYPFSPLESQARHTFAKIKATRAISNSYILSTLKKHAIIAVGDDAAIGIQQRILIDSILSKLKNKNILIVTNRSNSSILSWMKKNRIRVISISNTNVEVQTRQMHSIVRKNSQKYDHILIWTGHLRLSSTKFQKKFNEFTPLYVYLQSNELRWKFPNAKGWRKISNQEMAWMDNSPLISIDHFRSQDEKDFMLILPEMLDGVFNQMLGVIRKQMKLKSVPKPKKILHVFDSNNIHRIQKIKNIRLRTFIQNRIMKGESAVMPKERMILLSTLNSSHMAEEAAHYLRIASQKYRDFGPAMTMVEEALAFFASLVLFPHRQMPIMKKGKSAWDEVHSVGYELGFKLWKTWNRSKKSRPMIQKMWQLHPMNEFEAKMMLTLMMDLK